MRSGPATVGVLLALGVSGTTLYYDVQPEKRPVVPTKVSAELTVLAVERNVSYGDYLRLHLHASKQELANARKNGLAGFPVDVVFVQAEIEGLRDRDTTLRWWLYDGRGRRMPFDDVDEHRRAPHKQETLSDRFIFPVWVSVPKDAAGSFVRVELYVRDVLLAMVDSPALRPRV
jgi:hypothetical protein